MSATVWSKVLQFFPTLLKGNSGAAPSINWPAGSVQSITLNAATVTPTFVPTVGGANLALVITQDGVGGRAVTWPAAVSWIGGTAPILLSGAGQTTLVYFYWDGTTYWGSLASGASPASIIPWTAVAAGTALAASLAKPNLAADSSGAQSTITLPTAAQMAASDGYEFTIKATGAMVSPVIVAAGAGTTLELLNAPGTFGSSTWLPIQGQSVVFKYDLATTTFKMRASSEGSGAPGTSAYNPQWFAAGTPFFDPQNTSGTASDSNAGTTSGTALLHYAEAVRRWGSNRPNLSVNTALTWLSSHTDNTDPVVFDPFTFSGAYVAVQGTTPATTAAVFTLNTSKNRAAGANSLLSGSFSAGVPAQGVMVQNTTALKSSRATVYTSAGGANWNMTQPLALQSVPTTTLAPTEVDTWATNDTVNLLTLVAINLVSYRPIIGDTVATDNFAYLYQCVVFDPNGVGKDNCFVATCVQSQEVVWQRNQQLTPVGPTAGTAITHSVGHINSFFMSKVQGQTSQDNIFYVGGACVGGIQVIASRIGLDGDFICAGFLSNFGGIMGIAIAYFDSFVATANLGMWQFLLQLYGSHVLYGTTTTNLNFADKSIGNNRGGVTYTAAWTFPMAISTGAQLNGASTGQSHSGATPDVISSNITTTVAHLDAAAGVAGFGGTAFNLARATITNAI